MRLTGTEFGLAQPEKHKGDDLIGPAFDEWLDYQKVQNTFYTWRSYRSIVKEFREFLATKPRIKRLRHVTADTAMEFRRWAVGRSGSKVTVDNNLVALRSAFNYFRSKGKIGVNPFSQQKHGVKLFFKEDSPRRDTYTDTEYSKIIAAAEPGDRPVYALLGNLGLRASELAMLECTDIDERTNTVSIRRKVTNDGIEYAPKDKTDRFIPMDDAVRSALQALGAKVGEPSYIVPLPQVKSRRDYFERSYLGRLKRLSGGTGIPEKKLTLHNFRRFFVSQCADCGIPMATVMNWLGHDEMNMVMYYYRLRDESAQQAMNKFRIQHAGNGADAVDNGVGSKEENGGRHVPPAADPRSSVAGDRVVNGGEVRRARTSSDSWEHLGNGHGKTAFSTRKRGQTERAGFEPAIRV